MKAQMYNYSTWIQESEPDKLNYIKDILINAGFGIMGITEHHFNPFGYSCIYLLSESHLSLHTFPEENSTHIQLTSCVSAPFNKFITLLLNQEAYDASR